jgi:hypothetical protein
VTTSASSNVTFRRESSQPPTQKPQEMSMFPG